MNPRLLIARTPALAAIAAATIALTSASASASVLVSGPSPPECSGPVEVPGYEVEPSLAADPRGGVLVGAYQQDRARVAGRGSIADMVAISTDEGRTWSRQLVEGVSRCGGGAEANASDPWVDIGPDGTIYVSALGNTKRTNELTIWVQSSRDGGETWDRVLVDGPNESNDKETLTADPFVLGRAWVAWQGDPGPNGPSQEISRTLDGGRTWSDPVQINEGQLTTDVHILPVAADRLLAVYSTTVGAFSSSFGLESAVSTDGGLTWSEPREVTDYYSDTIYVGSQSFRAFGGVFSATTSPDGTAYAVVQGAGEETSGVELLRSADGGESWSSRVVATRRGGLVVPVVAAAEGGSVAVTYIAVRRKGKRNTRYRIALSSDRGETWEDRPLTRSFNPREAQSGDSIFLADYTGLAALPGGGYGALITAGKPLAADGPTDVRYRAIGG